MSDEFKQLIEDAAELLGIQHLQPVSHVDTWSSLSAYEGWLDRKLVFFNPLDPERGDLWKVAEAAELDIYYSTAEVVAVQTNDWGNAVPIVVEEFTKGDYQSLALAILRAASAVWKAKGEE